MTDTYLPHGWPAGLPDPDLDDPDGAQWWRLCHARRLAFQRCDGCGTVRFPPRPICHHCTSPAWTWHDVGPGGEIYSVCEAHYAAHPGLTSRVPYLVVLVSPDGADGERLVGNLVQPPSEPSPTDLFTLIGRRVTCIWEPVGDTFVLPQWRLNAQGVAP